MKKKTLIIQIDGLPFDVLKKEIDKGNLPFLKSLLKREYSIKKIITGLPATTSYFQSELMYGDSSNIPGMTWFSKKESKFFYMTLENEVREVEKERKCKKPLLKGGASVGNIFSGGARINFTPSFYFGLGTKYFPRRLMILSLFLLPFVIIFDFFFFMFTPFRKGTFTESFFGEWITRKATFGVLRSLIKRKVSPIYVTFMSYDSRSHPFGREHKLTLSTLPKLDGMIEKIFKLAGNDYEIFILSDHGQVDTLLFRDVYKKELPDLISFFTGKKVINSDDIKKYLIFQSVNIKRKLKKKWQRAIFNFVYSLGKKYYHNIEFKKLPYYNLKKNEIIFVGQGDMAQIYLGESPKNKMNLREINKFYPFFLEKLFSLPEIETISTLYGKNKVKIMTKNEDIKKNRLFLSFIKNLSLMENSGDIIIFGKAIAKNKVISFASDKRSVHGGIERGEQEAFIILPKYLEEKPKKYLLPLNVRKILLRNKISY